MLRNGTQKLYEKGTSGFLRGTFVSSGRCALGCKRDTFAQFVKKWGGGEPSVAPPVPTSLAPTLTRIPWPHLSLSCLNVVMRYVALHS